MIAVRKTDFDEITKVRWQDVLDRAKNAYIFQTYGFQRTWWEYFGKNNPGRRLLLLVAEEKGGIAGIAPLMEERIPFFPGAIIRFIGTPVADYIDFIAVKGREPEVASSFISYLKKENPLEIDLFYVPDGSSALEVKGVNPAAADRSPYIELKDNWEETFAALNGTVKRYVRRRERKIAGEGTLEFGYVKNEKEKEIFLEEYFRIHVKRWRDFGGRYSQFQYEVWRNFVRGISEIMFPAGMLDLSYLKLNSEIIACHFGFVYNKVFHWYMPAFNPDYSRFSPGNLFIKRLMEHSVRMGLREFDFLRGEEGYKIMWAGQKSRKLYNILGYSDNIFTSGTGRLLRNTRNFYNKRVKDRIKKVRPLMKIWYGSKG